MGAGCVERHNLSQVVQVCHQAIAQWGAPEERVSDHGQVFAALSPCLEQLAIRWSPIERGHPWQHLAESGFGIQRRMVDASVVGCTTHADVYRQHACMGKFASTTLACMVEPALWSQIVEVFIYDDAVRIEHAAHLIVVYPCLSESTQRRIITVDAQGRQHYRHFPLVQLVLFTCELLRVVWEMPPYQRSPGSRQRLLAPQRSLFERFTKYIVQIRGEGARIQHPANPTAFFV